MANLHDSDGRMIIVDFIEDAEIPLPEPELALAGELLASRRTRLIRKGMDPVDDSASVVDLERFQLLDRRWLDTQLITCHGASDL